MKNNEYIETNLANYYGEVSLRKIEDKNFLTLENYNGNWAVEVSEEFAFAFEKEFKNADKKTVRLQY